MFWARADGFQKLHLRLYKLAQDLKICLKFSSPSCGEKNNSKRFLVVVAVEDCNQVQDVKQRIAKSRTKDSTIAWATTDSSTLLIKGRDMLYRYSHAAGFISWGLR